DLTLRSGRRRVKIERLFSRVKMHGFARESYWNNGSSRSELESVPGENAAVARARLDTARVVRGLTRFRCFAKVECAAEVAQLVEQPIRNRQVPGSSPGLGSSHSVSRCRIDSFRFVLFELLLPRSARANWSRPAIRVKKSEL